MVVHLFNRKWKSSVTENEPKGAAGRKLFEIKTQQGSLDDSGYNSAAVGDGGAVHGPAEPSDVRISHDVRTGVATLDVRHLRSRTG